MSVIKIIYVSIYREIVWMEKKRGNVQEERKSNECRSRICDLVKWNWNI